MQNPTVALLCGMLLASLWLNLDSQWRKSENNVATELLFVSSHLRISFRYVSVLECFSELYVWLKLEKITGLWCCHKSLPDLIIIVLLRHPEGEKAAKCYRFDGVAHICMITQRGETLENENVEMMSSNKANQAAGVLLTLEPD